MNIFWLVMLSVWRFGGMVVHGSLRLNRDRVGRLYTIDQGRTYQVFRETDKHNPNLIQPVVLVVGFRLKLIGNSRRLHWLFQRGCILTTPFWSGFAGFSVKLWMVEPQTQDYLGIYQWADRETAMIYAQALVRILRPLSTIRSVWFVVYETDFEKYLNDHSATQLAGGNSTAVSPLFHI